MSHSPALQSLRQTLDDLRQQCIAISGFCQIWRAQTALLAALPARYAQVMEDVLGRMEAGSLFSEESCSFSQEDLRANLAIWLDKAEQTLATQG